MARANFVKKARKDVKGTDIKAGESYWWWQLYRSPKRYSRTKPRGSQLTGSEFLSQYYGFNEELEDMTAVDMDDLQSQMEDLAGRIRELGEEQSERRDNMPEGLQDADTGNLLQERADGMEGWAGEIEGLDFEFEPDAEAFADPLFKCSDECGWTGGEMPDGEVCPDCNEAVEHSDEYKEALAERIQELIDEASGADPGLS